MGTDTGQKADLNVKNVLEDIRKLSITTDDWQTVILCFYSLPFRLYSYIIVHCLNISYNAVYFNDNVLSAEVAF